MKIKIIQTGKTKDNFLVEGIEEYLKRLKPFLKIETITLKEFSPSKTVQLSTCVLKEGEQILKAVGENDYVICLDEKGKQYSSVNFADNLSNCLSQNECVTFVIGGPFGLSNDVRSRSNEIISLSNLTFTHRMVRLILLEQIYRAVCIINKKEYHVD